MYILLEYFELIQLQQKEVEWKTFRETKTQNAKKG